MIHRSSRAHAQVKGGTAPREARRSWVGAGAALAQAHSGTITTWHKRDSCVHAGCCDSQVEWWCWLRNTVLGNLAPGLVEHDGGTLVCGHAQVELVLQGPGGHTLIAFSWETHTDCQHGKNSDSWIPEPPAAVSFSAGLVMRPGFVEQCACWPLALAGVTHGRRAVMQAAQGSSRTVTRAWPLPPTPAAAAHCRPHTAVRISAPSTGSWPKTKKPFTETTCKQLARQRKHR